MHLLLQESFRIFLYHLTKPPVKLTLNKLDHKKYNYEDLRALCSCIQ
nr:MAG TPA: hypothetical protein [Caudoviricetes sp.]